MEIFGVKFAALGTPLERRLQTAAVLFWASYVAIFVGGSFILFLYLFFFTNFFWIPLLYLGWLWFDFLQPHKGGRRSECFRNCFLWKYVCDFFPVEIIKTADLDPEKNYICGYHPHGIISIGAFTSFATGAAKFNTLFPNVQPHLLTLNLQFWFPIYRDVLMAHGICAVSKESIRWLLSNSGPGKMVVIVIGGAKEALDAHPGIVKLTLRRRQGFVREAIQNGALLVPTFSFGENELFSQIPNPKGSWVRKVQDFFCSMVGVSPPIFAGRGIFQYNFGYLPYRIPIHVVVGKAIDVGRNKNPTQAEIDKYHQLYMEKLKELFDEHKKNYEFYKDSTLEFV